MPQPVEELDYNNDNVTVAFEVGYEPQITIDLAKYEAPHYKVEASEKRSIRVLRTCRRDLQSVCLRKK